MNNYKDYLVGFCFITFFSCSQYGKQICQNYKTGHFSIHSEETGTNFTIIRTDTLQIQTEKETGRVSEWRIRWINDCEYTISLLRDNYDLKKNYEGGGTLTINYKIIKPTNNYYIFEGTVLYNQYKLTDTIWKTK